MCALQSQNLLTKQLASLFPQDFIWGTATASYQVEGAIHEDGRGPSIWDTFSATPGKTFQGDTGEIADDHYHRMTDDVALMSQLGLDAYRFSISWSRIYPQGQGEMNEQGLAFYERLMDTLLEHNIKPFVTLFHWDLPQALEDNGGWTNRETAYAFADYAETIARRLGDRVAGWITLNEPWCAGYLGYGTGVHAPGVKDRQSAIQAAHHLLLAHGLAVPRVRAASKPGTQVGITLNFQPLYPADDRAETLRDLAIADEFSNRWFADPLFLGHYPEHYFEHMALHAPTVQERDMEIISTPIDFLGINCYSRSVIRGLPEAPLADAAAHLVPVPSACYTEMAWEVYPNAIRDLLLRLHNDYHPQQLYVTENGAAFKDEWDGGDAVHDPRRVSFYQEYIAASAEALQAGVPLKGYFAWSLMDNFEWAEGYSKRFGLIYVDYQSQRRILKDSALWYAELLAAFHSQA